LQLLQRGTHPSINAAHQFLTKFLIHFEGLAGHPVRPSSFDAWRRAAVRGSSVFDSGRLRSIHLWMRRFVRRALIGVRTLAGATAIPGIIQTKEVNKGSDGNRN
jgi:hypothetical protein